MNGELAGEVGGGRRPVTNPGGEAPDVGVILVDRLAAVLVHHEPGWRLPRPSTLARRYNVRPAQVEQAVRELTARHLIRRLPDGQLYRAGPAEYLIEVPGMSGLGACIDPMGNELSCRNRKVSWRRVPGDIGGALGMAKAESACIVTCQWLVNDEPAAISTTYLTKHAADQIAADVIAGAGPVAGEGTGRPPRNSSKPDLGAPLGLPAAAYLEMQPPPPAVARRLRLGSGQLAVMVTVRYDDPASRCPAALTVAALRPDLFRVVFESPAEAGPIAIGPAGAPRSAASPRRRSARR